MHCDNKQTNKKMITKVFKISEIIDPNNILICKMENFCAALRFIYSRLDYYSQFKKGDPEPKAVMNKFGLQSYEYEVIYRLAKAMKKSKEETDKLNQEKIDELQKEIDDKYSYKQNKWLSKKEIAKREKRIAALRKSINSDICFGSKSILRKITRECNKPKAKQDEEKLQDLRTEYKDKRNHWLKITGETSFDENGEPKAKGNRNFDVTHLHEGYIIYKPNMDNHVRIEFKFGKREADLLKFLSEKALKAEVPITVTLTLKEISIAYEEERITDFYVDKRKLNKELSKINDDFTHHRITEEERKMMMHLTYCGYEKEAKRIKIQSKINGRCLSVDLNPTVIGYSVLEKTEDGNDVRIIECGLFDMSELSKKLSTSSFNKKQLKQNAKRVYELSNVIKKLFKIAKHYQCSVFVLEDLKTLKGKSYYIKEVNRKIKNIWNRELIERLIVKRCKLDGLVLERVNPAYTSFIGNIKHPYADPTNASIEIGRRGLYPSREDKRNKEKWYPEVLESELDTVKRKFKIDAPMSELRSWFKTWAFGYKSLHEKRIYPKGVLTQEIPKLFSGRLRAALESLPRENYQCYSMSSYRSKVKHVIFNNFV